MDTATKEFLAIEFKRTQDARSNYVERATAVAQEQYKSPLAGLQAVGQVKGWKVQLVQQIVFLGGTCGSLHVESFNRNVKALGVRESKWDPIRKKLVRRLLEEQHKVLRLYFAQKGGTRSKGGDRGHWKDRDHVQHVCVKTARADRGQVTNSCLSGQHGNWGVLFVYYFLWICLSLIKSSCEMYIVEAQVKRASEEGKPVGWR